MTRSESLQKKVGKKVECDICHKLKFLDNYWMMNPNEEILCPECVVQHPEMLKVSFIT